VPACGRCVNGASPAPNATRRGSSAAHPPAPAPPTEVLLRPPELLSRTIIRDNGASGGGSRSSSGTRFGRTALGVSASVTQSSLPSSKVPIPSNPAVASARAAHELSMDRLGPPDGARIGPETVSSRALAPSVGPGGGTLASSSSRAGGSAGGSRSRQREALRASPSEPVPSCSDPAAGARVPACPRSAEGS
jgi:hypothetical protein